MTRRGRRLSDSDAFVLCSRSLLRLHSHGCMRMHVRACVGRFDARPRRAATTRVMFLRGLLLLLPLWPVVRAGRARRCPPFVGSHRTHARAGPQRVRACMRGLREPLSLAYLCRAGGGVASWKQRRLESRVPFGWVGGWAALLGVTATGSFSGRAGLMISTHRKTRDACQTHGPFQPLCDPAPLTFQHARRHCVPTNPHHIAWGRRPCCVFCVDGRWM
jgi:hypothetical protein